MFGLNKKSQQAEAPQQNTGQHQVVKVPKNPKAKTAPSAYSALRQGSVSVVDLISPSSIEVDFKHKGGGKYFFLFFFFIVSPPRIPPKLFFFFNLKKKRKFVGGDLGGDN